MSICVVTGSAGLIGAEAVRFFSEGFRVVGIDNDMREQFFGADASTEWSRRELEPRFPDYTHHDIDIRDRDGVEALFSDVRQRHRSWSSTPPPSPRTTGRRRIRTTDFSVNANGT